MFTQYLKKKKSNIYLAVTTKIKRRLPRWEGMRKFWAKEIANKEIMNMEKNRNILRTSCSWQVQLWARIVGNKSGKVL